MYQFFRVPWSSPKGSLHNRLSSAYTTNKLKNWRRVATRYEKANESYLGFVAIAAVKLWMPFVHERYKGWHFMPHQVFPRPVVSFVRTRHTSQLIVQDFHCR